MEKMIWEKPQMNENVFPANAYCSSCGPTGYKRYNFVCDAPAGDLFYYDSNNTLVDCNEKYGWYGYNPCGDTHTVDVKDGDPLPFFDGFVDRGWGNEKEDNGEGATIWIETWTESVKIDDTPWDWTDDKWHWEDVVKYDGHATSVLDIKDIEVAKS